MKKPIILLALMSSVFVSTSAHAVILSYWSFNTTASIMAPFYVATELSSATLASSVVTTNFSGSSVEAQLGEPAGQALAIEGGTSVGGVYPNNGGYLTVALASTTHTLSSLTITFASRRTSTGFNNNALSYSLNGTTFTNFQTGIVPVSTTAFAAISYSLPAVPANTQSVWIRYTLNGATSALGNNRVDNLRVEGDLRAVPEPATMLVLAAGLASAAARRRRK